MSHNLFRYEIITDDEAKLYNAIPGTVKITDIQGTDHGVVNIPETIDDLPVTMYAGGRYHGEPINKLILPKTLITLSSVDNLPDDVAELVVAKDHPVWSTDGVSLLSKDGTKLIRMCQKGKETYTIPDGVTTIGSKAFYFNKIREITIPDSVTTVEDSAFSYCSSLATVHGGQNIVRYGWSSFKDTEWYQNSPLLILGTTLLRCDTMDENVVVPEGIEVIGPRAFSSDGGRNAIMETVTLPSTIKEIGESAFHGKTNLKEIRFPEGLQKIDSGAFYGCRSLCEILLPDSIVEIGQEAFIGCSSVTKVVLPHAVSGTTSSSAFCRKIENGILSASIFSGCTALEHIDIPEGIVAIGEYAFNHCENLKNIRIPTTVTTIGKGAFAACCELEQMMIPAGCVEIGQSAFPHSTTGWGPTTAKFRRIDVDPQNERFCSVDGVLFSKNADTIVACPSQYGVVDYTIPDGVKEILPGAFEGCDNIKRVVLPQSLEKIGERAFASMSALKEIVFPSDFPVLGKRLFWECANLKHISWPNNLREIGEHCFASTGIENIVIPETVERIKSYAFSFIKAKSVRLPKTVKDIELSIFAGVPEIEVYDTIDSDAKPAADHVDSMNGNFNGKVGFIGIHQKENYLTGACNANWHEHTIIVRSAEDDSEKFRVRMPKGQQRKVYCTFASAWGRHAEFCFNAVDAVFKDLTADAKLDYALNRLHWQAGITEDMLGTLNRYVARNAKDIANRLFATDAVEDLALFEPFGIVKKNTLDDRIEQATKANATKCTAWLLNWQNSHVSAKERAAKEDNALRMRAPTVADVKKIWPHKKGADGGLMITGYNGKDIDVRVPEIIGKTPVTAIADDCFSDNKDADQKEFLRTQLRSVEIPDSVVEIGGLAFWGCEALERVQLPKKIKKIPAAIFSGCKNLAIDIPKGVKEIGGSAFEGCSMKSLTIPATVKVISATAFGTHRGVGAHGMPHLERIEVEAGSQYFKSVDGVLFSIGGDVLLKYPEAKPAEAYEIPDGVTRIAKNAFSGAEALKHVTIPASVDIIEDDAFFQCPNLETVGMPESLSQLGFAFGQCVSLKEITVPVGVVDLPDRCFAGCRSLVKVSLPKGLKKIGYQAFASCTSLSEVDVPTTVRGISEGAFAKCTALKKITVPKATTGIGWGVFYDCKGVTIHTPAGSKMYAYAKTEKIKVKELSEK